MVLNFKVFDVHVRALDVTLTNLSDCFILFDLLLTVLLDDLDFLGHARDL